MNNIYAIILTICFFTIFPIIFGMIWGRIKRENYLTDIWCEGKSGDSDKMKDNAVYKIKGPCGRFH